VIGYDQRVSQTLALINKCLDVGATLPSATDNAAPTQQQMGEDALADEAASCELIARSAAGVVVVARPHSPLDGFVRSLLGLRNVADTRSVIVQFLAMVLGIAGVAIALGLGTKGRITGIWIDERNRVSLARAQVTLWTIVALGGFAVIALYNIGLGAPVTFPRIPTSIVAALGIAFASPMLSALILDRQAFADPKSPLGFITTVGQMSSKTKDFADREAQAEDSKLEARALPDDASLADVFLGEHVADSNQVDISRLQNVVLTVTLVFGYFAMLLGQLASIVPESLLSGLSALPDAGATFTSVLLASHATYLGTKVYGSTGVPQDQH
jgi:flagellar motor switch/type III secretory pathway protein FliN